MSFKDLLYDCAQDADGSATSFYGFDVLERIAEYEYGSGATPPLILSSSEPWPGGTCTTDAVSPQWRLDSVDISGATSSTYTPIPGDVNGTLTVRDLSTGLESTGIEVEYLRGVTRSASTNDRLGVTSPSMPALPAAVTIGMEIRVTGGSASDRRILQWLDFAAAPNRKGIVLRGLPTQFEVLSWYGPASGNVVTPSGFSIPADGQLRRLVVRINGTSLAIWLSLPGGTASLYTTTLSGSPAIAAPNGSLFSTGGFSNFLEGSLSIAAIGRAMTFPECESFAEAPVATGGLRKAGWLSDPDLLWSLDPALTESEGDSIAASSDLLDTIWIPLDGSTRLTSGGINE